MFLALLEGYLVGLSLIVLIGPVLFILLNTTIQSGYFCGLSVAFGIFVSDLIAVSLCYQGSTGLASVNAMKTWLCLGGGLITLTLGLRYCLNPSPKRAEVETITTTHGLLHAFIRGFTINLINPFVFLVWLGIIAIARDRYPLSAHHQLYLISTLLGILTLDVSKVFLAERLHRALSPTKLTVILRCSGVILILFALRLLWAVVA